MNALVWNLRLFVPSSTLAPIVDNIIRPFLPFQPTVVRHSFWLFPSECKSICRTLSGSTAFMRIVWRSYLASGHSPATRISDVRMTMRLRFGFAYAFLFWFLFLSVFLNTKELSAATRYRSLAASDVFSNISSHIYGNAFILSVLWYYALPEVFPSGTGFACKCLP